MEMAWAGDGHSASRHFHLSAALSQQVKPEHKWVSPTRTCIRQACYSTYASVSPFSPKDCRLLRRDDEDGEEEEDEDLSVTQEVVGLGWGSFTPSHFSEVKERKKRWMYRSRERCLSLNQMLWVQLVHVCMSFIQLAFDTASIRCQSMSYFLLCVVKNSLYLISKCIYIHKKVCALWTCMNSICSIHYSVFNEHVCASYSNDVFCLSWCTVFIQIKLAQYSLLLESSRNTWCLIVWHTVTSPFNLYDLYFV